MNVARGDHAASLTNSSQIVSLYISWKFCTGNNAELNLPVSTNPATSEEENPSTAVCGIKLGRAKAASYAITFNGKTESTFTGPYASHFDNECNAPAASN